MVRAEQGGNDAIVGQSRPPSVGEDARPCYDFSRSLPLPRAQGKARGGGPDGLRASSVHFHRCPNALFRRPAAQISRPADPDRAGCWSPHWAMRSRGGGSGAHPGSHVRVRCRGELRSSGSCGGRPVDGLKAMTWQRRRPPKPSPADLFPRAFHALLAAASLSNKPLAPVLRCRSGRAGSGAGYGARPRSACRRRTGRWRRQGDDPCPQSAM